jgi:hypothetical protein
MFIQKLRDIKLQETNILVSFDIALLFTRVPMEDTIQILSQHFQKEITHLIPYILTTTYFAYDGTFYEQTDGTTMDSPLAPVILNIYLESFERQAVDTGSKEPTHWYRYIENTFMVWPHGVEELQNFLLHPNNLHPNIKFMMEIEKDNKLAFLDVLVRKKLGGSLGHNRTRGKQHTH